MNSRKVRIGEMLEAVRERDSNEIGFINYAKNTIKVNNINLRINRIIDNMKGGLYAKRHIVCPFCVQKITINK